jgi:hypothetical protein
MKKILPVLFSIFAGCAHPYSISPITEKIEKLNGREMNSFTTKKCALLGGYETSTPEELLIHIRVTNKSEAAFEIDSSYFSLSGAPESIQDSPLAAQDPDRYLKELNTAAELQDSRTKMESYQGIEALGTLKGENSDRQIESASDQYKEKQKDAERARKTAAALRKRAAMIAPLVLKKTTVKSGESVEGALIVRAAFKDEGVVTLESTHPACKGNLRFLLRK